MWAESTPTSPHLFFPPQVRVLSLEPAESVSDFLDSPAGRYVAGRTWFAFCESEGIAGFVMWDSNSVDDIAALITAVPVDDSPLAESRARFVDLRRLGAPQPGSFELFTEHFVKNRERMAKAVSRAAIVHSRVIGTALAAGFSAVAPGPYPTELFSEPSEALGWLGARTPTALAAQLDEIYVRVSGTAPLLRDLRACLQADLRGATIARAAAALAMSRRSLQRRLFQEERSTFQAELLSARVQRAKDLLLGTSYPLKRIALQIGFASAQHFGVVFRRATGESPRLWRMKRWVARR
jgi:AraC-like DNA-binding protein